MTIEAKTIMLKGCNGPREEALAHAAGILPGHLVKLLSTGKVSVHSTAGGNAEKLFAIEDELQGRGITTAYGATDRVSHIVVQRGDWVNALIKNGENIVIGDALESAGDGTLRKHIPQIDSASDVEIIVADQIVGYAMAACDMSGSSGVDPSGRCAVRAA